MPMRHGHWSPIEALEARCLLATITWDGGAGTSSWHDAANWSTDTLPGADDDVVIDTVDPLTVEHSLGIPTLVRSILNEEGLSITAGEIATTDLFLQNGAMTISGGAISGSGDFHLRAPLAWSGGAMTGTGRTFVLAGGGVINVTADVFISRLIYNDAVFTWQAGNLVFSNGVLTNRATGTINAQSPGFAFGAAGTTNSLVNNGTLKRNGTSVTTTTFDVRLSNTGFVQVVQGTLRIRGGGTSFSGSFIANPFTTLTFASGNFVAQATSTYGGGGTHVFNSGVHTISAPFSDVGSLFVQGATLKLLGGERVADVVKLLGGTLVLGAPLLPLQSMNWTAGTVRGPGRVRILEDATLTIAGAAEKFLENSVLENQGSAIWGGGRLSLNAARIENSGTFRALGDRIRSFGGGSSIENTGSFKKEGGLDLLISNQGGGVAFNNASNGSLVVQGGALLLLGGGVSTGSISGSAASSLLIGGIAFTIAGGTVTGLPTIEIGGAATWTAGTISGPGTMVVSPGGSLIISGAPTKILGRLLANNAVVSWIGGILQLDEAAIVNAQTATLNIGAAKGLVGFGGDSRIDNFGVINKTGTGVLSFETSTVRINNQGTLNVLHGTFSLNGFRVVQMVGGTLSGGTWSIQNGSSFNLVGSTILVNNAVVSLAGNGAAFNALRLLTLNNGTLSIIGNAFALQSNGNQLTQAGTLNVSQGGTLAVLGKVIFANGSQTNFTITSPSVFGRVTATGALQLDGNVAGSFLFAPAAGSLFHFLAGSERVGEFDAEVLSGSGVNGEVQYISQGARWRIL